jgi:hypothetical protein
LILSEARGIMKKRSLFVDNFFFIAIFLMHIATPIHAEMCVFKDGEIVGQREVIGNHAELTPKCDKKAIKDIVAAKEVVKKYWKASDYERYEYFSKDYKAMLKRVDGIEDAKGYSESFSPTERIWQKQIYQKCYIESRSVQIIVLATWSEENYHGVMTFIFDMMKEDDGWKIVHIHS